MKTNRDKRSSVYGKVISAVDIKKSKNAKTSERIRLNAMNVAKSVDL